MENDVSLSRRESDVMSAVFRGYNNQQIADHLGISINTVKTHLQNVYGKLHVSSKPELILKVMKLNAAGQSISI